MQDLPGNVLSAPLANARNALGEIPGGWLIGGMVLYHLAMVLLIPTPWWPNGPGFPFATGLAFGLLPVAVGLLRNTPSAITAGFVLASTGPYNQTTVMIAFALGVYLGIKTLWLYRPNLRELFRNVFVKRGFYLLLAFAAYVAVVWVLRLGESTDGWSFLALASSLMTVPFAAYSLAYLPWDEDEVRTCVRYLFYTGVSLAAVALLYPLICGRTEQYIQAFFVFYKAASVVVDFPFRMEWIDPDFNRVGFSSSHYFAVWMLIFAFAALTAMWVRERRVRFGAAAAAGLFCFALGENAHILPGAAAGVVSMIVVAVISRRSPKAHRIVAAAVMTIMIACVITVAGVMYFNGGRYSLSQKASLYRSAVEHFSENADRIALGDGPASFASRAANKRLTGSDMEIEYSFPFGIPDYSQPAFAGAVRRSRAYEGGSTMKRPLSGMAGILVELGIVGTLFLLYLLYRLVHASVVTWTHGKSSESRIAAAAALFGLAMVTVSLSVRTYYEYAELSAFVSVLLMLAAVSPAKFEQR